MCSAASFAPFPMTSPYTDPEVEKGKMPPIRHVSPAPAYFALTGPMNCLIVATSAAESVAPVGLPVPAVLPPPLLAPPPLLPLLQALSSGNVTPPATAAAAPRRKVARLIGVARPGDDSLGGGRSELVMKFTSVSLKSTLKAP